MEPASLRSNHTNIINMTECERQNFKKAMTDFMRIASVDSYDKKADRSTKKLFCRSI